MGSIIKSAWPFGSKTKPYVPAPYPHAPILGMNSHMLRREDLEHMQAMGISHVRTTLLTQWWDSDEHAYQLAMRQNLDLALSYGMKVCYTIHNAYGPVFWSPLDYPAMERYARTVGDMATKLRGAEAFQLWNEMEAWVQPPFGTGAGLDPYTVGQHYVQGWGAAYHAIKNANPDLLVVTGGTAGVRSHNSKGEQFLRGMMSMDFSADAIAVHAYGPWDSVRENINVARSIIKDRAPLWLTEFGTDIIGPAWTPEHQLRCWQTTIEGARRERTVERLYGYALQTDPNDPWHGVFNVDGTPRPLYEYLRN